MKSVTSILFFVSFLSCRNATEAPVVDEQSPINLTGTWSGTVFNFVDVLPYDVPISLRIVHDTSQLLIQYAVAPYDTLENPSFLNNELSFVIPGNEVEYLLSGILTKDRVDGRWSARSYSTGELFQGSQWYIQKEIVPHLTGRAPDVTNLAP